jgi:hypothetical protein
VSREPELTGGGNRISGASGRSQLLCSTVSREPELAGGGNRISGASGRSQLLCSTVSREPELAGGGNRISGASGRSQELRGHTLPELQSRRSPVARYNMFPMSHTLTTSVNISQIYNMVNLTHMCRYWDVITVWYMHPLIGPGMN